MEVVLSYILVNYKTPGLAKDCIASIRRHTRSVGYEIIVVDNASTEASATALQETGGIRLIRNAGNPGFGAANNQGALAAVGQYLFFLNTDTWLLNDAAAELVGYLEGNPAAGCCGADLFTPSGERQVSYGNFPTLAEAVFQLGFRRLFPRYYNRHIAIGVKNEHTAAHKVDYVSGAAMCVRKELFGQLGGFDQDFFLYFEETEFAWRLRKAGYTSVLVPSARIVHLEGGSHAGSGWSEPKQRQFIASRKLYFRKTRGNVVSSAVTGVLAIGALMQYARKRDSRYLKLFRILVQS